MTGMDKGRFSDFPGFGIHIRRKGFGFLNRLRL
jgi:hypothetical protein